MPKRDIPSPKWEDVKKEHNVPPEGEPSSGEQAGDQGGEGGDPKPPEAPKAKEGEGDPVTPAEETPPVDYEAQLASYKKRAEDAEATAEREANLRKGERQKSKDLATKLKKKGSDDDADDEDGADPQGDIATLVAQQVTAETQKLRRDFATETIDEVLQTLSDNPTERELIKAVYDTDLKPSGFTRKAITADLEKAKVIANKDRIIFEAEQRGKAKVEKAKAETATRNAAGGGGQTGRALPQSDSQYTPQEQKLLKAVGKDRADGE